MHGEDDTIYIVYKGTSTTTNALTDLKFTPNRDGFHSGIASDYERTATDMLKILENIRIENTWSTEELSKHLVFTGHSLGGGLAQVAAFRWKENHPYSPRVVTFAAPAVMTDSKAKQYDEEFGMRNNTLTVVQAGDPVPVINITGTSVGTALTLPYSKLHFWHQMAGYMMALGALDQAGTIKTERSCLGRWLHWSNVPLSFSFR